MFGFKKEKETLKKLYFYVWFHYKKKQVILLKLVKNLYFCII